MYAITANSYRAVASPADVAFGESIVDSIPQELLDRSKEIDFRNRRNGILRGSDWTQVGDSKVTGQEKAAWQAYRQALRDLPQSPGWPNVQWPTPPALADTSAGSVKSGLPSG